MFNFYLGIKRFHVVYLSLTYMFNTCANAHYVHTVHKLIVYVNVDLLQYI